VLKWGSLALAAWEAYRIWQQMKNDSRGTSNDTTDSNSED
jgi:hypothetical protein